jgi:hypothetical protein
MEEDKGIIGTLADVFDECAEAVEEMTGKPAKGLRKGARVCRKTRKTAKSIEAAAVKAQKVAVKAQNNSSIPKLINQIKNTKIVGFQPYPDQVERTQVSGDNQE